MPRLAALIMVVLLPAVSYGDCIADHASIKTALSGESLSARNELFLKLCQSLTGEFVDVTDPALEKRFQSPWRKGNITTTFEHYPHDLKASIIVAYLVDLDGSVKYPTLIIGSGNASADAQAVKAMTEMRFREPGKVNGIPIRALMYWRMLPLNTPIDTRTHHGT